MDKIAAYEMLLAAHPLWEKFASKEPASSMGVYELPDHLRGHFKITHKRPVLIEMSDRQIARIRSDGFSVPKRVSPEVEAAHWKARSAQAR